MRRLVYVPMIHSRQIVKKENLLGDRRVTEAPLRIAEQVGDRYWAVIKEGLDKYPPGGKYRFYVESVTGKKVVRPGSDSKLTRMRRSLPPEWRIMDNGFIKRVGGIVEATEDPELHQEALALVKKRGDLAMKLMDSTEGDSAEDGFVHLFRILSSIDECANEQYLNGVNRDLAVIENIGRTLQDGETGFLFFGGAHDIARHLPKDIHTDLLDERLVELRKEAGIYHEGRRREESLVSSLVAELDKRTPKDPEQHSPMTGSENKG